MMIYRLIPIPAGLEVALHWEGNGYYAPIQADGVIHEYWVGQDGIEAREIAQAKRLGTPHWVGHPGDYSEHYRQDGLL